MMFNWLKRVQFLLNVYQIVFSSFYNTKENISLIIFITFAIIDIFFGLNFTREKTLFLFAYTDSSSGVIFKYLVY